MAGLLVTDHAELDSLGRDLLNAFDHEAAPEVLKKLDLVWARLAVHIRAEHLHLFPALLDASKGVAAVPSANEVEEALSKLREDHNFFMRELAACVETVREQAASEEATGLESLEPVRRRVLGVFERLREHNRLEEEEVYHWPLALLSGSDRDRQDAAVRRELENLPPRFAEHRDRFS
jgi:iron-sulfur cluster repair protein YtfE (RIC family)